MDLFKSDSRRKRIYSRLFSSFRTFCASASQQFIRRGKWGPLQVYLNLMTSHLEGDSKEGLTFSESINRLHVSLGDAFNWGDGVAPSLRSFQEARTKVTEEEMHDLRELLLEHMPCENESSAVRISGIRFLHGDGTQVHMPNAEELVKEFGQQTNGPHATATYPQGKWIPLIEGGSNLIIDDVVVRCKDKKNAKKSSLPFDEREGLELLRKHLGKNDCMVWDSGVASRALFYDFSKQEQFFIIPITKAWNLWDKFKKNRRKSWVTEISVPPDSNNKEERVMTLRLVRVQGPDGKTKILATNIISELSVSEIRKAYKQRWSVEVLFRHCKEFLSTRCMRSKTLLGVKQELSAISVMCHMTAFVQIAAIKKGNSIRNTFGSQKEGFKKPRIQSSIYFVFDLLKAALLFRETIANRAAQKSFACMCKNVYLVDPYRSYVRESKHPIKMFRKERPSKSMRESQKKKMEKKS